MAEKHCRVCGVFLTANPAVPRTVCRDCFVQHGNAAYTSDPEHLAARLAGRVCEVCGKTFKPYQNNSKACSKACRRKTLPYKEVNARLKRNPNGRARKAKENALRKMRVRTTAENIDPIAVFERNRWRCQICGTHTLKSLRGSHDDRAPELDHIIPLAAGGTHTWANVQCSCRKCNGDKGSTIYQTDWIHSQQHQQVGMGG